MFRKKASDEPVKESNEVDEQGSLNAWQAAAENQNKALVARVAVLENVVKSHGQKIEENDESWKGYSKDMGYLREERNKFKRDNDNEHSEFKSGIENLKELKAPKMDGWGIREQLNVERKRREKIANEKGRGAAGLAGLQSEPVSQ